MLENNNQNNIVNVTTQECSETNVFSIALASSDNTFYHSTSNEPNYIQALLNGNTSLINEIYKKFAPKINYYIQKKGGKKEDAQDVFQEALVVIMRKAQDVCFELNSSFYSFLFGICRNIWLQKIIPETKRKTQEIPSETFTYLYDIEAELRNERTELYKRCLSRLSEDNRKILELSMIYSYEEIAEIMGIESYGYLRIKKMRAKKELIEMIKKDPIYQELRHYY